MSVYDRRRREEEREKIAMERRSWFALALVTGTLTLLWLLGVL